MESDITPRARFSSDRVSEQNQDLLGFSTDARALATLVLSKSLQPPLSIGLFGASGAGNTFFMHLLAQKIDAITTKSFFELENLGQHSVFCSKVVQVQYNALNNVETSPWIGMTDKVFDCIRHWTHENSKTPEKTGHEIFRRLPTAQKLRRAISSKIKSASAVAERAKKALDGTQHKLEEAIDKRARCIANNKWEDVKTRFGDKLSEGNKAEINGAGEKIGFKNLIEKPEYYYMILEQAKTLKGRAELLKSSLIAVPFFGKLFWAFLGIFIAILFITISNRLYIDAGNIKKWIDALVKVLSALSTIIGIVGVWYGAMIRSRTFETIETLQKFEGLLEKTILEAEQNKLFTEALAEEVVSTAREKLIDARNLYAEAFKELTLAEQELKAFEESDLLFQIGNYYRENLLESGKGWSSSIVPTIRADFDSLSTIILEYTAGKKQSKEAEPDTADFPIFERIIFYVDDLDECPPRATVSMLQAIYQLMSFPIFILFVAANPLWLLHSLQEVYPELIRYPRHLGDYDADGIFLEPERISLTDKVDYLSKILQIPFWISPAGENSAGRFIQSLVTSDPVTKFTDEREGVDIPVMEPHPEPAEEPEKEEWPTKEAWVDIGPNPDDVEEIQSLESQLQKLQFGEKEQDLMLDMSRMVGRSPRNIIRFINLTRLVKLTLNSADLAEFIGIEGKPAGYPAVFGQLAIVVAVPNIAPNYFRVLWKSTQELNDLQDLYRSIRQCPGFLNSPEWEVLFSILKRLEQIYRNLPAVSLLRRWSHIVTRYSFNIPPIHL